MIALNRGPIISSGLLLGAGLGGFFDGILLHQLLQWHNLLSSVRPPIDLLSMKYNMLWDGFFHAFCWLMVVLGVWRLWTAGKRSDVAWSRPSLLGGMLLGWGIFNFFEGLVDHHLLGLHHVHPGTGQLHWDVGFLLLGLVQIAAGGAVIGRGAAETRTPRSGT
ncbi:MAG TPA: DUF2243 domain-containing protein [Polyangiaceae bacterium]|nr:DUF2243 domain-containing protein [Polyangiaceae bacterium]